MNAGAFTLVVDHREKGSKLANLAMNSGLFKVTLENLRVGDYIVEHTVLVERKSPADIAASIIDGRIFRQAASMARSPLRTLFLIEEPEAARIHPHALIGTFVSLAVIWRQPLITSGGPEESLTILRILAEQAGVPATVELPRYGYRPKRLSQRKLFVLQGLPGVGPKLATSLLRHFGSVEKVMAASVNQLQEVRGCGSKKAAAIRGVVT